MRALLADEFARRKRRNPRYSLRSFAKKLGVHNSSLSRLIQQRKRLTKGAAKSLGMRLGLSQREIAAAIAHENAEILAQLVGQRGFRADSRWLAVMSGLPIDDVNVALHALLHSRRLTMIRANEWRLEEDCMGNPVVRWQIVSPQPETVASFHSRLFGWSVRKENALGYRELSSGNSKGIDGGVWPAPPEATGFVQLYVAVPDVDACVAEAVKLRATIIVPKSMLPDGDSMAVLRDPTGIPVAICTLGRAAQG
jgi:predicted enzyme related to lactoylglutathione lyase